MLMISQIPEGTQYSDQFAKEMICFECEGGGVGLKDFSLFTI
jgi:hypothetical protein